MIDFDELLVRSIIEIEESSVVTILSEEFVVIEKGCEDKEVDENTFIYKVALWYESENNIDNISLSNA